MNYVYGFCTDIGIKKKVSSYEFEGKELIVKKAFSKNRTMKLAYVKSYEVVDSLLKGKRIRLTTKENETTKIPIYYINADMILKCAEKYRWKVEKE